MARTDNPSALMAAGDGMVPFLVPGTTCSCGLYQAPNAVRSNKGNLEQRRKKYERLGWSQPKIERALLDNETSARMREDDGLNPELVGLLSKIMGLAGKVLVWVHWFSGSVEKEPYQVASVREVAFDDLPSAANALVPDVVLVLRPS
jgi:hypothetical protein